MKRIILSAIIALTTSTIHAQSLFSNQNEYGDYIIFKVLETDKPADRILHEAAKWCENNITNTVIKSRTDTSFNVDICINIKSSYVPGIGAKTVASNPAASKKEIKDAQKKVDSFTELLQDTEIVMQRFLQTFENDMK